MFFTLFSNNFDMYIFTLFKKRKEKCKDYFTLKSYIKTLTLS